MTLQWLHITNDISEQCKHICSTGRRGELIVRRYQQLLKDLREFGPLDDRVFLCRTKKGEQRRKNCIKYDLGGGYRLVSIKEKQHLYLVFLGNHDETDHWFLRHGDDPLDPAATNWSHEEMTSVRPAASADLPEQREEQDQYETALAARLDEPMLRYVFCGLTGPSGRIYS